MKVGSPYGGYTIVEVLIFLAVTGALFVAIFPTISGQQRKTEFKQAVKDVETRLQDIMNDVSTGYYPQIGSNYRCSLVGGHPHFEVNGGSGQGTNEDCIFIGKAIQFGDGPSDTSIDQSKIRIYTIAGRRLNDTGKQVADLKDANPEPVVLGSGAGGNTLDLTEDIELLYGLKLIHADVAGGPSHSMNGHALIGIFSTFGQTNSVSGNLESGSQVADLAYIHTGNNAVRAQIVAHISNFSNGNNAHDALAEGAQGVILCFQSGGTDQVAIIEIGGQGRKLTTHTQIMSTDEATTGATPVCA
jgi:type II secretory pathway pseudopilin PulG